jgi:hypothetical protein
LAAFVTLPHAVYISRIAQIQSDLLLCGLANRSRTQGPPEREVEHMCDVLLGYMYEVCNNSANACRLHYCMGVLNYTFAPSPNVILSIDQRVYTRGTGCLHRLRFSIPCTFRALTRHNLSNGKILYSLMYFFKPLNLSFACSSTSSSLQIANRSQSSAR